MYKMFLLTTTKMSEFMMIHSSHFGCIKSTTLTGLRQIYIGGSCTSLGIGIKISGLSVGPSVIDPNEGCCITRCTFLLTHIISRAGEKLKRPTKKSFHVFSFDDTESCGEVWRWKGPRRNLQDNIVSVSWPRKWAPHRPKHKVLVCGTSSKRNNEP